MGPVFVCSGNDVWLINGDKREKRNTISAEYTVLKTIDHIPLALFVLLDKQVDKPLSGETIKSLADIRSVSGQAASSLVTSHFEPDVVLDRLIEMCVAAGGFINQTVANGRVSRAELDGFIARIQPATMANVDDAIALELSSLDTAVQDFRKEMTPEQWKTMHVVITGGHMPRDHERRLQYFQLLFDQKDEGDRVIYQEGSDDIDKAIDLVATHVLDASISREYFKGDNWRMHRDLLSDGATKWLREHPPAK
jgi:hypothetical protein